MKVKVIKKTPATLGWSLLKKDCGSRGVLKIWPFLPLSSSLSSPATDDSDFNTALSGC